MNQNGRFQTKDIMLTTDTRDGIIYLYTGEKIVSINLISGEKKQISIKGNNLNKENIEIDTATSDY